MFTNSLSRSANMSPVNIPNEWPGQVIGDLGEIGNLYNKEHYNTKLKDTIGIFK